MAQMRVYRSFIKKAADEGKHLLIWDDSRRYEGVFKGFDPQGEFVILTDVTIKDAGESIFSPEILIPISTIKIVSSETEEERTRRLKEEKSKVSLTEAPAPAIEKVRREPLQPPQIEVKEEVRPLAEELERPEEVKPGEVTGAKAPVSEQEVAEKPGLSEETRAIVEEMVTRVREESEAEVSPEVAEEKVSPAETPSEAAEIEEVVPGEVEKKLEKAKEIAEKPIAEKAASAEVPDEKAKKVQARLKAISEESQKVSRSPYFSRKKEAKPAVVPKRRIDVGTLILDVIIVILAVIAVLIAVVAIFGIKLPF